LSIWFAIPFLRLDHLRQVFKKFSLRNTFTALFSEVAKDLEDPKELCFNEDMVGVMLTCTVEDRTTGSIGL
jgi:hypothetical protein